MPPDQQNQNSGTQPPQPGGNGYYPVVPALPSIPNDGHSGHNPYEFIFATPPPKKSLLSGNTLLMRIGLIVGIVTVLVIAAAIALAALAPTGSAPGMISMAARQQEILRIARVAPKNANEQYTLNFVANVNATITTDKRAVALYLSAHNTKVEPQMLTRDRSTATDTLLKAAASTNTYDSAVTQNLTEQLEAYQKLAKTTYSQSSNKQAKELLQRTYGNATKLLEQARTLQ